MTITMKRWNGKRSSWNNDPRIETYPFHARGRDQEFADPSVLPANSSWSRPGCIVGRSAPSSRVAWQNQMRHPHVQKKM